MHHATQPASQLLTASSLVTSGQTSRRYFSRYCGKSVAKEDSSSSGAGMNSGFHSSIFQCSMPSWSHGLSLRYLLWSFFAAGAPSAAAAEGAAIAVVSDVSE
jgi:hypothetical protein